MFALGVSVLPWLGGCAVTMAWLGLRDGTAAGRAIRDLVGGGFVLVPVLVFLLVLAATHLSETGRFKGWFGSRFAVGFGVMVLSGFTAMALGAGLAGEGGFVYASMFVMFSGYPLFAFAAGALLHGTEAPTAEDAVPQLTNRP